MNREHPISGTRAAVLAAALFAITFNFLQPLAHAAMLRDGAPQALWTVFCNSIAADADSKSPSNGKPAAATHDCCLGLAHAPVLVEPSPAFVALEPVATKLAPLSPIVVFTPVGIRDGPTSPRGPPSLV
jgi:Protein of unknown function (DUF2946)